MPLYPLTDVRKLVQNGKFALANSAARRSYTELAWKTETMCAFLLALRDQHYKGQFLAMSAFDGRKLIDCDAYRMCFNEVARCEGNPRSYAYPSFFAKIGIHTVGIDQQIAVVSFHL